MSETQSAPESPVREGDVLAGKYLVERVLGVGGMGVVVAAMHLELEERVALKFLLPSAAQNPAVVARFSREARAVAKIKSQHVARVIDVGTLESGVPYIVMEYLEGKDLADVLLMDGRLSAGKAVDYVLQASEALAEAHAAGFVHRDLKPPNLFLAHQADGSSIIKVLDFGISKAVIADEAQASRSLTSTTDIFGSPMYMSPEQLKSARDVDARADIWALGVILYELISGHAPFDRPTVAETFGAILYEQPVPLRKLLPDLPADLDRVILRCLDKDKTARPGNVAELAKALFPFAASAQRTSLDRTSRVLRRAGVTVDSIPPPPGPPASTPAEPASDPDLGKRSSSPQPVGAQTRTAWDTASHAIQAQRSRSSSRTSLVIGIVVGAVAAAAAGMLLVSRLRPAPPPVLLSMQAEHPTPSPSAPPMPSVTPATSATPGSTESAVVAAAALSAVPSVTAGGASAAPAATTAGGASAAPGVALAPHGRGGRGNRGAAGAAATGKPASKPPAPAGTPSPKAPDGDDFGDRK